MNEKRRLLILETDYTDVKDYKQALGLIIERFGTIDIYTFCINEFSAFPVSDPNQRRLVVELSTAQEYLKALFHIQTGTWPYLIGYKNGVENRNHAPKNELQKLDPIIWRTLCVNACGIPKDELGNCSISKMIDLVLGSEAFRMFEGLLNNLYSPNQVKEIITVRQRDSLIRKPFVLNGRLKRPPRAASEKENLVFWFISDMRKKGENFF